MFLFEKKFSVVGLSKLLREQKLKLVASVGCDVHGFRDVLFPVPTGGHNRRHEILKLKLSSPYLRDDNVRIKNNGHLKIRKLEIQILEM